MKKVNTILIIVICLLGLCQAGLIYAYLKASNEQVQTLPVAQTSQTLHQSYVANKVFYDEAYELGQASLEEPAARVYAGIIPHHLIVKDKIAAWFSGLEKFDYETVVLIGPNHFNTGRARRATSTQAWQTPYGVVDADVDLINKIISKSEIKNDPAAFTREHSMSAPIAFIKKSFPKAKVVPLIIKDSVTAKEADELAQLLFEMIDPEKTLVIASIDFSHEKTADEADKDDEKSFAAISNFNVEEIYNAALDSRPSVYCLLKYLQKIEATKASRIFHTNSGRVIGKPDEPTTSHQLFYFTK